MFRRNPWKLAPPAHFRARANQSKYACRVSVDQPAFRFRSANAAWICSISGWFASFEAFAPP